MNSLSSLNKSNFQINTWNYLLIVYFIAFTFSQTLMCQAVKEGLTFEKIHSIGFTENKGQITDQFNRKRTDVFFKSSNERFDLYITKSGLSYVFKKYEKSDFEENYTAKINTQNENEKIQSTLYKTDLLLINAVILKENIVTKEESDQGVENYLISGDEIKNIKTYHRIIIKNIYKNIDWVLYYNKEKGMKYDFIIHPGALPEEIKMQYTGAILKLNENATSIEIETPLGKITEGNLKCFQNEKPVKSLYQLHNNVVQFKVEGFAPSQDVIIDPPLVWSTLYGGKSAEFGHTIAIDRNNNVFLGGAVITDDANTFPLFNAGTYFLSGYNNNAKGFILKFNSSGQRLWATFLGSTNSWCHVYAMKIDAFDNLYVTGWGSTNNGAFPYKNMAGAYNLTNSVGMFLAKFDNNGNQIWCTGFGSFLYAQDIDIDCIGNIYVVGGTHFSVNQLTVKNQIGAYNNPNPSGNGDGFITKFSNTGALLWSTFYGGSSYDGFYNVVTDDKSNVYVQGYTYSNNIPITNFPGGYNDPSFNGNTDVMILKFNPANALIWSSYFGGAGIEGNVPMADIGSDYINIDCLGNFYLVGGTTSANIPVMNLPGAYNQPALAGNGDGFIAKFNGTNLNQIWTTYLGGPTSRFNSPANTACYGIISDGVGNIYIAGTSNATAFPLIIKPGYNFSGPNNGFGFITEFDINNSITWSTFLRTRWSNSPSLDYNNNLYLTGEAWASDNPSQLDMIDPGSGAYFQPANGGTGGEDTYLLKFGSVCAAPNFNFTYASTQSTCAVIQYDFTDQSILPCSTKKEWFWEFGDGSTSSLQNPSHIYASPGTYTIKVKITSCNCRVDSIIKTLIVPVIQPLTLTTTSTNTTCNAGKNGTANANPGNGVAPYTYSWSSSGGQTSQNATGLSQGIYTVTVTDAVGCNATATAEIISPSPLTGQFAKGTTNCTGCGCKEWIMTTATGGTSPYSYSWQDGYINRYKNQLCPGNYAINITDKNGCSVNINLTTP